MNTIPLPYDSLRVLTQHLDANLRFELISRCPSLRKVEKTVPLYIKTLDLNRNYECKVNDIQYKLNIVQFSREGPTPQYVLDQNKKCGFRQDIDRFGDIIINPLGENWHQWDGQDKVYNEGTRQAEKNILEAFEDEMKTVMRRGQYDLRPSPWSRDDNQSYGESMQYLIDYQKFILAPYTCREQNIDSPYDRYVELRCCRVKKGEDDHFDEIRPFETVKYSRKLNETMKYFMTRLFGGRVLSIHVKLLTVRAGEQIIRLPEGVKFNVQKFFTMGRPINVFDALLPIIDENCNPWKHVQTRDIYELDRDHVKKADEITIRDFHMNTLQILQRLTNQKVFVSDDSIYFEEEMCNFIQHWLENGRKIGTCYRIAFRKEQYIMLILDRLEKIFENEVTIDIDKGLMILPMKGSSELHISYGKPTRDDEFEHNVTWVFKLEVVASDMGRKRDGNN
ncbi:unnamed protein product [Caenorhabditis brenneri]